MNDQFIATFVYESSDAKINLGKSVVEFLKKGLLFKHLTVSKL